MFEVTKVQLHAPETKFEMPSAFGIYKTTGGEALGIVGKDFAPTQPQFIWDNLQATLVSKEIDETKMTFTEVKGGRKIIIKAPVQTLEFKNQAKKGDVIEFNVAIMTGYDGKTPTTMFIDVMRLICTNGMKATSTEFRINVKNVKGNIGKINMLCDELDFAVSQIGELREQYKTLAQRKITKEEQNKFILDVTGVDINQYAELSKHKVAFIDDLMAAIDREYRDGGTTAWALLNGITRYTNHLATKNTNDYIYADAGMFMNDRAQKQIIEFIK